MKIKIRNKIIDNDHPPFIIAEAGINHNGKVKLAKKLIHEAKNAGADAIKFQTYKATDVFLPNSPNIKPASKFVLNYNEFEEISDYCKSEKIIFCSTPFSEENVDFLDNLNVPFFKIASGDLTHLPLLNHIASKNKPIILSVGMGLAHEIKDAINTIHSRKNSKIILMHSVSGYPTPVTEANLNAITTLRKKFHLNVGFSDNGPGILVPLIAITLGANVIEKHFTLNNNMNGPDHAFSANPVSLQSLVQQGRQIKDILGSGKIDCQKSELIGRTAYRRSIYSSKPIMKGTKITKDSLTIVRPSKGLEPKHFPSLLNKIAKKNIPKFKSVNKSDFK